MVTLFQAPRLSLHDQTVIEQIHTMRADLAHNLRTPKRWTGGLRRTTQARAIQGSNSIEGYLVDQGDALAAVDDEPPVAADQLTWLEILGYRRVLTYVINVGCENGAVVDESVLRSMHFMLLEHDLSKAPGRYRTGPIYVHDANGIVYTAPDPALVPGLMADLDRQLQSTTTDSLVSAAMAHLNLVMIHPFRDGNGRMARALQTMILGQDGVLEPAFSSIEEWLGKNTTDYYAVLAATGGGAWNPGRNTDLWIRFNLRAYHMQAQTITRRFAEAIRQWEIIDQLLNSHHLADRMADAVFEAWLGSQLTRPVYAKHTGLDIRTATRDLTRLVEAGMLQSHGQTKGRYYTAGPQLLDARDALRRDRQPLSDPYPGLMTTIANAT